MATFVLFDQARIDMMNGVHNLTSDDIRVATISSATTPAQNDAGPHFGGTGTTDLSTNEVTGGNVTAGGLALDSQTVSGDPNTLFNAADEVIAASGSNPNNVRHLIYYNNTDANNRCLGFVSFGVDQDLSTGTNTIDHTNGIFQMSGN